MNTKAHKFTTVLAKQGVECWMLPNGKLRIGVSQLAELLPGFSRNANASLDVEALLDNKSRSVSTERIIGSDDLLVVVITPAQFLVILSKLKESGDPVAAKMYRFVCKTSLNSLMSEAFYKSVNLSAS